MKDVSKRTVHAPVQMLFYTKPNERPHCAYGDLTDWRRKTLKGVVESEGGRNRVRGYLCYLNIPAFT